MASVLAWADAYNTYNIQAHTYDTYNTDTCIHIHTHTCNDLGTSDTYRYIQIHTHTISVMKGFWGAAAAARVSYAQHHLPRSDRTGSGRDHRVPIAIGGPMGCAGRQLWPPRRVQRARVRQNGCGNGSLIAG